MALTNQVSGIPENIKGTRFENISNPYSSLPRTETKWDKFLNWLGFRSGYDKAQEQYNQSYNEYNAQLSQLASEEAFNSPLEQSERMRQAGLNPDLTGLAAEPASEFDNQQSSPDISAGTDVNPLEVVQSIGHGFLSAFTGSIGIISDLNLLNQSRIETDKKDLEYQNAMLDFFTKSDPLFQSPKSGDNNFVSSAIAGKGFFRSSRNLKRFNRLRSGAVDSLLGLTTQYKSYDDFAKSAENLGTSMSNPFFSGFGSLSPKDIADFLRPMSKGQFDLIMAQLRAENAKAYSDYHKAGFEGDAYAKLDRDPKNPNKPSTASEAMAKSIESGFKADIAENKVRESVAPLTITKNKIIGRMIQSIESIPDRTIGHQILKFFLVNQLSNSTGLLGSAVGLASKVL